jgi:hypothetical protein
VKAGLRFAPCLDITLYFTYSLEVAPRSGGQSVIQQPFPDQVWYWVLRKEYEGRAGMTEALPSKPSEGDRPTISQ